VGLALAAALILIPSALLAGDAGPSKVFALAVVAAGMLVAVLIA
jgi:hypothetical protein